MYLKSPLQLLIIYTLTCGLLIFYYKGQPLRKAVKLSYYSNKKFKTEDRYTVFKNRNSERENIIFQANQNAVAERNYTNFQVNQDAFGIPDNEPHLYLRSAYFDYRLKPPITWILAVVGKSLKIKTALCYYRSISDNGQQRKGSKAKLEMINSYKSCFFQSCGFSCNTGDERPDLVTLTFGGKGKKSSMYSLN